MERIPGEIMELWLGATWANNTLADCRAAALRQANGTSFNSLRQENGPVKVLMVCLTRQGQIDLLQQRLGVKFGITGRDWGAFTMTDLWHRAVVERSVVYEFEVGTEGSSSLAMMAADPDSCTMMRGWFGLSASGGKV